MMFKKLLLNHYKKWFVDDTFIDEKQTDILEGCLFYMRLFRIWPKKGQNLTKFDMALFCLAAIPVTPTLCFAEIVHIFATHRNYLVRDILDGASLVGSAISVYWLIAVFVGRNKDIQRLVFNLGNFETFRKPRHFDKINKRINIISHIIFVYIAGSVCIFGIFGLIRRSDCLEENKQLNLGRICGMIAPSLLPASFNEDPHFWIGISNQIYNSLIACISSTLILYIIVGATEMLVMRIQDLKLMLKGAFDIQSPLERKQYLKYCVRYHCHIIALANQLNDCFASLAFIIASFTSTIVAMVSFQFMLKPELMTLLNFAGWTLMLMLLSTSGQRLIDESAEIANIIYSTDWFVGDVQAQTFVQMIIMRSNRHLYITSIFSQISYRTFSGAMQNAYSLLTLLAQMQNE